MPLHHFASNVVRCGDASQWPPEVKRKVSGWGAIKEMPDRYSQETADLENYKIRIAILDLVWGAVQRTPEGQWPAFGGWHLFAHDIPGSSRSLVEAVEHHGRDVDEPDRLLYGEELAGSDLEEFSDDDDGEEDPTVQPARGRPKLPEGWSAVMGNRSSGAAYIKHYLHATSGKKLRSVREIEDFLKS